MHPIRFGKLFFMLLVMMSLVMTLSISACGDSDSNGGGNESAAQKDNGESQKSAVSDGCEIVTESDATALFGRPAVKGEGSMAVPGMLAECIWEWDTELAGGILQFRIWDGTMYYSAPPDSTPFDIGEQGYIRAPQALGADIMWIQDEKTIDLSYFNTGFGAPPVNAEQVKHLARKVSDKL